LLVCVGNSTKIKEVSDVNHDLKYEYVICFKERGRYSMNSNKSWCVMEFLELL